MYMVPQTQCTKRCIHSLMDHHVIPRYHRNKTIKFNGKGLDPCHGLDGFGHL